jgi:hypothetical protein
LEDLTTPSGVGSISNMKAVLLARTRIVYSGAAFAELVLWQVPRPVAGSVHEDKYRLAYVVDDVCVLRYDNEAGKGDHLHFNGETPEQLIADFQRDIARWNDENPDS